MVLVTGASGFIGRAVVLRLLQEKRKVRVLMHTPPKTAKMFRGFQIDTAITSITDERGVKAALKGVKEVVHCASAEWESPNADLETVDIHGTATLINALRNADVKRVIYFSHLGADRASIFPLLKVKAIAEELIKKGQVPYTIIRCAAVYGPGDHLISWLTNTFKRNRVFFTVPGDGKEIIQPLWIDDLTAVTQLLLDDEKATNKILPAGGGEYFTFKEALKVVLKVTGKRRILVPVVPAYLRSLRLWFGERSSLFPLNAYWLDYLAADRTCSLDSLPRQFGIIPSRFEKQLFLMKEKGFLDN